MTFLCDTNIISELARSKPNDVVLLWLESVSTLTISVVTVEEIYFGLTAKPNIRIKNWFESFIEQHCSVLAITPEIAKYAGELRGQLRTHGKTRTQADMLIAATAHVHHLTLVTRNVRDFEDCNILLLNPFI